jgi:hypothetical protein
VISGSFTVLTFSMSKQIPILVAVIALILIAWLIFRGGSGDSSPEGITLPDMPEAPAIPKAPLGN